jgi:cellulose synthase/poly-beta-1,6-N-acetylglucosamine synthase-like glycosyltransferase
MISFVIPAYNEEVLIARCVQSIAGEVKGLTHEIIVVDNASTDRTCERAEQAGAKVIHEKRKGVTRARQAGFEASYYDTIVFVDADTQLPEGWLKCALKAVASPQVVAASGPLVYNELGLLERTISSVFYLVAKVLHPVFPMMQGSNMIIKRSALLQAKGFDTSIEFWGDDTDTAKRLSAFGVVRFNLNLWTYSSARRVQQEGLFRTGVRYATNFLSIHLFGKPASNTYNDVRPD